MSLIIATLLATPRHRPVRSGRWSLISGVSGQIPAVSLPRTLVSPCPGRRRVSASTVLNGARASGSAFLLSSSNTTGLRVFRFASQRVDRDRCRGCSCSERFRASAAGATTAISQGRPSLPVLDWPTTPPVPQRGR